MMLKVKSTYNCLLGMLNHLLISEAISEVLFFVKAALYKCS